MKKILLLLLFLPFSLFSQSTVYTYTDPTTDTEIRLEHDNLEWELDNPSSLSNSGSAMIGKKINGKRDGVWRRYWSNGNVRHEETYQNGMDRGRYRYYWENGELSSEGFYWDGIEVSLESYYKNALAEAETDEEISLLQLEIQTIENEYLADTSRLFKYNGDLLYYNDVLFTGVYYLHDKEFTYVDGYKHGRSIYYYTSREKGDIYADENWKKGLKDGNWKIYGNDGALWNIESWKEGKKDGLWIEYDLNGVVFMETEYRSDMLDGIYRKWDAGNLLILGSYKSGKKDGLWINYYSKMLISRESYFTLGDQTSEINYFYGENDNLIRKETRNRGNSSDKYGWRYRLRFNTIETFHNLYDCKGVFCNQQKHFKYVLDFDSIDCSHKEIFLQRDDHKIQEYEFFLSKHKNHKLANKAKEELLIFKEERDYKLAKKINKKDGYNEFISLYPNSEKNKEGYNDGTLERIILIDIITKYNNILNRNSVEDWEEFLSKYPSNCNICMSDRVYEDAKYYLSFSKDLNAWEKAIDEGSYESYSEYLVNFTPLRYNSHNREKALERIDSIVKPEWEKTRKENDIVFYREFIAKYPNSSYLDLAHEAAWKKVKDKNRISYYNKYLDNFPNGEHIYEAIKSMIELEIAYEESRRDVKSGKLPDQMPTAKDDDLAATEHRFIVANATKDIGTKQPQTLLVSYRGVTSQGYIERGDYTIKIDECEEIILPSGSYFFEFESKYNKTINKFRNLKAWDFTGGYFSDAGYVYIASFENEVFIPVNLTQAERDMLSKKYEDCQ